MSTADRRRASRKRPPADAKVELTPKGMAGNLAKKVIDWSSTGACLVTEARLRPGASLMLELSGGGVQLRSKAVVCWSTTLERKGKTAHVCGLQIAKTPPPPKKDPKRRHPRFDVKEVVEAACIPQTWLSALGLDSGVPAGVRDLSHGGIRLAVEERLRVNQLVSLKLVFRVPNTVVQAEGIVRWCRRDTLSLLPRYDVGIVFKKVSDEMALQRVEKHFNDRR